jgi:MFS family permease
MNSEIRFWMRWLAVTMLACLVAVLIWYAFGYICLTGIESHGEDYVPFLFTVPLLAFALVMAPFGSYHYLRHTSLKLSSELGRRCKGLLYLGCALFSLASFSFLSWHYSALLATLFVLALASLWTSSSRAISRRAGGLCIANSPGGQQRTALLVGSSSIGERTKPPGSPRVPGEP